MEGNQEELSGKKSLKNEAKEFVGDLASTASGAAAEQLAGAATPLGQAVFIIKVILGLVAAVGIYILGVKFNLFPDYVNPKPVTITSTPLVVSEIKKISQLMSSSATIEVVVDSTVMKETTMSKVGGFFERNLGGLFGGSQPKPVKKTLEKVKDIVFIVRGQVFSGFDLGRLNENSIQIKDSSIRISIDEPKILDVVVNPADFEFFAQSGDWNSNEIRGVKNKAKEKIRRRAVELGIIERSRQSGIKSLESFYQTLGFKRVEIVVNKSTN